MEIPKTVRDFLLRIAKNKKVYAEGNFLKVLKAPDSDTEFSDYLVLCRERDNEARKKRLEITKQIQSQNTELAQAMIDNERVNEQLSDALKEADSARAEAEKLRDEAVEDLEFLQKKKQTELMGSIVKVALAVILGVGLITTALYIFVLLQGHDAKIIESTWSNLFGILLTNSFSIIGTIMGVKHATQSEKTK